MDWRKSLEELRAAWLDNAAVGKLGRLAEFAKGVIDEDPYDCWSLALYPRTTQAFAAAVDASTEKDMSPLTDYLRSSEPLGPNERERLAGLLPRRKKMGRPTNRQVRAAASMAEIFYTELRKHHRGCAEMKAATVKGVVEDYFAFDLDNDGRKLTDEQLFKFVGDVLEFMDRPRSRKETGEPGLVTIPLSAITNRQKS